MNKKIFKNIIAAMYFLVGFLCVIILSNFWQFQLLQKISNSYYTNHATAFVSDPSQMETIINEADSGEVLYYEITNEYRGIYFEKNFYLPILSGRFFTPNDLTEENNIIVIGKNHLKNTYVINGTRYLDYGNIKFVVIGIAGLDSVSSLDNMMFFNLMNIKEFIGEGVWVLDSNDRLITNKSLQSTQDYQIIDRDDIGISRLYNGNTILNIIQIAMAGMIMVGLVAGIACYLINQNQYLKICMLLGFSKAFITRVILFENMIRMSISFIAGASIACIVTYRDFYLHTDFIVFILLFLIVSIVIFAILAFFMINRQIKMNREKKEYDVNRNTESYKTK